jgi:hypothetical protein
MMRRFTQEQEVRLAEIVRRVVREEISAALELFAEISLLNTYRVGRLRADQEREKRERGAA